MIWDRGNQLSRAGSLSASSILIALCGSLIFEPPVGAEEKKPRYEKSEVAVEAKTSAITEVSKGDRKTRIRVSPTVSGEAFRERTRVRVAKLTDAVIHTLNRLIRITPEDDPEKPDFYFRLAEHFRQKKVQFSFAARELDETIFQAKEKAAEDALRKKQADLENEEKKWMLKAIKLYLSIASNPRYARYSRMDEVLFAVADMLNQAQKHDKARFFFLKLIKRYPKSQYVPHAYLSFAEHYFEQREMNKALKIYRKTAEFTQSPIYGYAKYKQGWCWINLKQPQKALRVFLDVVANAAKWGGSKGGANLLIREARKDAVTVYAQVGEPTKAWRFFSKIGEVHVAAMMEQLGRLYLNRGAYGNAATILKMLSARYPKSERICIWQYGILRAMLPSSPREKQMTESIALARVYRKAKKQKLVKGANLEECGTNAAGVLRELATSWHRSGQKTKNKTYYRLASRLYREYLSTFMHLSDAYEMAFFYGELLFSLRKWEEAASAYADVVSMKKDGKYLKEAAYAAVLCWKNALDVEDDVRVKTRRSSPGSKDRFKKRPLREKHEKMISAFDTYLKHVPKAKERPTIMYRKGLTYYEHNHFDRAAKMFGELATSYPGHKLGRYGANLLLDSLSIIERYAELEQWIYKLLKLRQLARGKLLATLQKLKSGIVRKKLEQLQKQGSYRKAAEGYAKLVNENPDDPRWAELAYNAAINYEAAKLIGQAIQIRDTLIKIKLDDKKDKSGRKLARKALFQVGGNYHALAWYGRAADYYERFAKSFPGEEEAPDALQNAIVFRLGRAEYEKAKNNVVFFASHYGQTRKYKSRAASAVFSLGVVYEQREDMKGLEDFYRMYLKKWGKIGGRDRQVVANVALGRAFWLRSCPVSGVDGACIKQKRVRSRRMIKKSRRGRGKRVELRRQCGPETKTQITVFDRDRKLVERAMDHFRQAKRIGTAAKVGWALNEDEKARRASEMRFAMAEADFLMAERTFENFLKVKFPRKLNFSHKSKKKNERSKKRFANYLKEKGKLLALARKAYQEAIKRRTPHWAIAGAARIGQLYQQFADALYTAPIPKIPVPKGIRGREQREEFEMAFADSYCDILEDKAQPLEDKAIQGLSVCLNKSTEVSWYNSWSLLCEGELNQIRPAEYPLSTEIRANPDYLAIRPVVRSIFTSIE